MSKIISSYSSKLKAHQGRRLKIKTLSLIINSSWMILGIIYLFTINSLTVNGFVLKDLQVKSALLEDQVSVNKEKVDSLQAYYSLNSRIEDLNMVAVDNIEFLTPMDSIVVKR